MFLGSCLLSAFLLCHFNIRTPAAFYKLQYTNYQTWSQGHKFQGQGQGQGQRGQGQGQGQGLDLQGQGQGLGLQGQGLDRQGQGLGPSPTYKVKAKVFTVRYITLIRAALSKSLDDDASMCSQKEESSQKASADKNIF